MSTGQEQHDQQDEPLRTRRERLGDAIVVHVAGELDSTTEPVLRGELAPAFADAAANGRVPVVVDLTAVDFVASVGMALLVEYHHVGDRQGTPLRVVAPAGSPLRALRAAMLNHLLRLYPSLPEARAAVSS
ncbi:STAS domain-containing protein [Saccharothrix hoggarensis]|uniref:STAS domain-containing protein n=1 Tax=Saccharothrix hoggarensis TaxID=913853 RepID=A0ABW3QR40_9PSEU